MKRNPAITGEILSILREANIHIDLISQFASQISFMFIIDERDIEKTITLLHAHYIEN
jgi:aspartokinase